jgi:hypothetical protein
LASAIDAAIAGGVPGGDITDSSAVFLWSGPCSATISLSV